MVRTLWVYWDKGAEGMPPLIRRIYQHNVDMCTRFGWRVVLLTTHNVGEYLFLNGGKTVPPRFFNMTPYDQSDFVRYYALRDYGGVWLDTDFIVHDNLDKLMAQMDVETQNGCFEQHTVAGQPSEPVESLSKGSSLPTATFLTIREHMGGCKASAILAAKPGSAVSRANCDTIERKMAETTQFSKWGEIGPEVLRCLPEAIVSEMRVINDVTAVASVNFANWRVQPGWNTGIWFKETPEEARKVARDIAEYQLAIVGTWTMYRNHHPDLTQQELTRMVFDDERSVFRALMSIGGND